MEDVKLYLLNASSFALATLNWVEPMLEILGYTVHKWMLLHKKKK